MKVVNAHRVTAWLLRPVGQLQQQPDVLCTDRARLVVVAGMHDATIGLSWTL